ncbi:putative SCF ubiquitin ligase complex subunit SKP2 RNJ42_05106 [Nakaseomyces bracarensis]|uniref:putative SCF ubiquitin ligase complex subunit SKP2 n=1 Tax=Nakaseomyces bracarensis TaxID=273131 RepID=UPI003871B5A2
MRKLQLFGRSKYFSLSSKDDHRKLESTLNTDNAVSDEHKHTSVFQKQYPELHLLSLPPKILRRILNNLDTASLISLSEVHSQLYNIISNEFLFEDVLLDSKLSLLKFNAMIHSEFHTANALNTGKHSGVKHQSQNIRFLVRSIEFSNPQSHDSLLKYSKFYSKNEQSSLIGGAYAFSNGSSDTPITNLPNSPIAQSNEKNSTVPNINDTIVKPQQTFTKSRNYKCYKLMEKYENKYSNYTYIELMLDIIDYLPNLTHVKLSHVDATFKMPLWYSVFNDGSRDFFKKIIKGQQSINNNDLRTFQLSKEFVRNYEKKFYHLPRIKTLEISADVETKINKPVFLRPSLLCCFGIIQELILENITLDTGSLDTPMEFIPLHLRLEESNELQVNGKPTSLDLYNLHSPVSSLTLKSCKIVQGNGILRLIHSYFKDVKNLQLLELRSKYDLFLCNCFSSLANLTIDCNSRCFTGEQTVNDDYYLAEVNLQEDHQGVSDDDVSITETLLEATSRVIVQAPPPTSAVVVSLNLDYISKTSGSNARENPSPSDTKKPALITKSQGNYFEELRIPPFHYFYHYYQSIWERIPHNNVNINIINIPFTNVYPTSPTVLAESMICSNDADDLETLIAYKPSGYNAHDVPTSSILHASEEAREFNSTQYYWENGVRRCFLDSIEELRKGSSYYRSMSGEEILDMVSYEAINGYQNFKYYKDIPNVNLWCFLKSLSKFKSVKINLLRSWLYCTPRSRYDWELLLKPVLNVNVPVTVTDRDGYVVYSYGQNKPNKVLN